MRERDGAGSGPIEHHHAEQEREVDDRNHEGLPYRRLPAQHRRAEHRHGGTSGRFEFQRPGRFRFTYLKPFEQTIVADGQTLWFYDVDLNQVTARKQEQALGSTPAALIAAAADLKALQAEFDLTGAADRDGLQWVLATPRTREGQLQAVRVGFRVTEKGAELAALDILDSFGQRSVLTFTGFEPNPVLAPGLFQFKPPAGAAVIHQ